MDNSIEQIIANEIHLIWTSAINKFVESGTIDENKNFVMNPYILSKFIHFMDKDYNSLREEAQWSDVRASQQILKALEDNGYKIVKKD